MKSQKCKSIAFKIELEIEHSILNSDNLELDEKFKLFLISKWAFALNQTNKIINLEFNWFISVFYFLQI